MSLEVPAGLGRAAADEIPLPIRTSVQSGRRGTVKWRGWGISAREGAAISKVSAASARVEGATNDHASGPDILSTPRRRWASLFLQLTLEGFDLFRQRGVLADQPLDLAHGVQNSGVVASAEAAADLGQRA
jgi:hypothetical protein